MSNWEAKDGLSNAQVSYGAMDVLVRLISPDGLTGRADQGLAHVL